MVYIKRITQKPDMTRPQYKKYQSKVAHEMLFSLVNKLYNVKADDNNLRKNKYGKPYIDNHEYINFSISHCDGMIAVAFGEMPLGVDVEPLREVKPSLAKYMCAENEYKYLTKPNSFIRLWTLKESYIKAIGMGLSYPLKDISFNLDGATPIGNTDDFNFSQYFFDEFVISLCYNKKDTTADIAELLKI